MGALSCARWLAIPSRSGRGQHGDTDGIGDGIAELSERTQIALDMRSIEDVVINGLAVIGHYFDRLTDVARNPKVGQVAWGSDRAGDCCGGVRRRSFRIGGIVPAVMDCNLGWFPSAPVGPGGRARDHGVAPWHAGSHKCLREPLPETEWIDRR